MLGKSIITIICLGIAAYLVVLSLLFFFQERLLFLGTKLPQDYLFHFLGKFDEKVLVVDGLKIHSLLFTKPASKQLILYFHGNAGDLSGWGEVASEISESTGQSVLMIDYPGYGKSQGTITSEAQLYSIAEAFLSVAAAMAGGESKIILYGRSIGTGIAALAKQATFTPIAGGHHNDLSSFGADGVRHLFVSQLR